NDETGYVVEADPQQIAEIIDNLYANKNRTSEMGRNGLQHYREKNISWHNVVQQLLS
ncbi:MAG: glycosyltransferase involved in cell wall biosynthesis, partial [Phenylobacterium sp.]